MEKKKHKIVFVKPKVNRIELDPVTVIDPNPLPKYTYGSASRETFPQTFPFVRKRIDDLLEKEGAGGVGVAGDVSTPTFGGSEGEGKEIDFFKTKGKIIDIINKYKIYLKPEEKPPKEEQLYRGPRGGFYYNAESYGAISENRIEELKRDTNVFWHGTASQDLRGGPTGLHVGTFEAAKQALEATIGIPVKGEWDGSREYGRTLLMGKKSIHKRGPYGITGFNVDAPEEDYYPSGKATYSNRESIPLGSKPTMLPVRIKGEMTNTSNNPHSDEKANGLMMGQRKRGTAKRGYYYTNIGEDEGSISAVVPDEEHLDILKYKIYLKPGEIPPEGKEVRTGSRDGKFYESTSRESTLEEASLKDKLKMNIIANKFKQFGFRLFEVGGSVRDELLGKPSSDRDFSTDALPEETEKILNSLGSGSVFTIGKEYGTIGLNSGDDKKIEITTFRDEVYPTSSRKPKVTFGRSLEKDLSRRDFTINAMARNTLTGELIDLFGGGEDLKNKIIRTVGNSKERYAEDPLRMLRAIRFASQLGFKVKTEMPEPEKLNNISRERVTSEFTKILTSNDPIRGLELLDKFGLMEYIIPDINKMKDVSQNVYHKYDVYDHTMEAVKEANKTNWKGVDKVVIMLAALLHDIGKPETKTGTNLEDIHFYGHQKVSTEKTENILKDLKFDKKTIERVAKLVELHMEPMMNLKEPEDITEKRVSKLIRKVGNDKDALILMDLVGTDNNASANPQPDIFNKLKEKTIEVINTQKPNEIVSPISGKEIMDTFGLKAGRAIGSIKDYLTGKVVEGELREGDKETANKLVTSFLNENPEFTKSFILKSIEKARIYLGREDVRIPEGKKVMFGPRGGRYYDSDLEVYKHFWEQAKERKFKEERITETINYLENANLPSSHWWIKVKKDGIIVGQAEKVQTVLTPSMTPKGFELTRNEEI